MHLQRLRHPHLRRHHATAPLGYDAQYASSDTGLIYLRNRAYDPTTAQFVSRDPSVARTRTTYFYGEDSPLSWGDPTGESILGTIRVWFRV